MKSESGPLKYRLARKWFAPSNPHGFELVLQGWFEWQVSVIHQSGLVGLEIHGEWRTLDTVDLDKEG